MAVVKYNNELNKVILTKLEKKEMDIFFTILFKMKEKESAVFSADEIKKYLNGDNREARFFDSLKNVFKTQLRVLTTKKIADYHLFITKEIDLEKKEVIIKIHPDCIHILNGLIENYTKFELEEFISLKSDYAKNLFRLLMQYRDTGWKEFEISEFRGLLEIPINYRQTNIDQKVIKPAIEELKTVFQSISVEKLKKGSNKRDVSHIKFKFKLKTNVEKQDETIEQDSSTINQESIELDKKITTILQEELTKTNKKSLLDIQKENIEKAIFIVEYVNKRKPNRYNSYLAKCIKEKYADEEFEVYKNSIIEKQEKENKKLKEMREASEKFDRQIEEATSEKAMAAREKVLNELKLKIKKEGL